MSHETFMVSQNAIPSRKHLGGSLPYVFTEQGVASLAGVLKSTKEADGCKFKSIKFDGFGIRSIEDDEE